MSNSIFNIQNAFFSVLDKNTQLSSKNIKIYTSVSETAIMPYMVITTVKTWHSDSIAKKNHIAEIEISIFDNANSTILLSEILDIIEEIINKSHMNNSQNICKIISLDAIDKNYQNNIIDNVKSVKIRYNIIFTLRP